MWNQADGQPSSTLEPLVSDSRCRVNSTKESRGIQGSILHLQTFLAVSDFAAIAIATPLTPSLPFSRFIAAILL